MRYARREGRSHRPAPLVGALFLLAAAPLAAQTIDSITERGGAAEGPSASLTVALSEDAPSAGVAFTVASGFGGSSTAEAADVMSIDSPVSIPSGTRSPNKANPLNDDDKAGVNFIGVETISDEQGRPKIGFLTVYQNTPATYQVVLTSRPVADVTINVSGLWVTVSPASHTFAANSANDWREPKQFTVTAGGRIGSANILHTVTTSDPDYSTLEYSDWSHTSNKLNLDIRPPLPTRLTLHADPLPAEGGGAVTVTAALDNPAPKGGTMVRLTTSGTAGGEGSDYTLSSTTISIGVGQTTGTATITVTDDSADDDDETIVLEASSANPELTSNRLTLTIEDNDDPAPLTASFEDVPEEHGAASFTFRVRLSETVGNFSNSPRRASFEVTGGKVLRVKQVTGGLWQVRVRPSSWGTVEVTLTGGRGCDEAGAVCTPDGRPLSNTVSATVRVLPGLKVAGGRAKEGKPIDFAVKLGRASSGTVTVDYATEDETASAGSDYTAVSGTLTFAPGETEKAVRVETLADTASEGKEVFRLKLRNASGARIVDGKAAGWINNVAAGQTAGDRVPGKVVGTEETRALAIAGELSPEDAAGALLARSGLEEKQLEALDALGNANGRYDIGDLLSWIERCREGGATCGTTPGTTTPASDAALPGAIGAAAKRPRRRAPGGRLRKRARSRRSLRVLAVLLAVALWSCDGAGVVEPSAPDVPEPGALAVEWAAPAGGPPAAGALVEIDGPHLGDARAPGELELYAAEPGDGPRRFVIAGDLRDGPTLEIWVPDRRDAHLYKARVVEVAGEDHRLLDADRYRAGIASN